MSAPGMTQKAACSVEGGTLAFGHDRGRTIMLYRISRGATALAAALCVTTVDSQAWDDSKYPDFSGQWRPIGGPGRFDISKPAGRRQQAPLTPEYQAIFEVKPQESSPRRTGHDFDL